MNKEIIEALEMLRKQLNSEKSVAFAVTITEDNRCLAMIGHWDKGEFIPLITIVTNKVSEPETPSIRGMMAVAVSDCLDVFLEGVKIDDNKIVPVNRVFEDVRDSQGNSHPGTL